jgi:hypothetical protein
MKKVFYIFVAVMAFGLVSCNNNSSEVQKTVCEEEAKEVLVFATFQQTVEMDRKLGRQVSYFQHIEDDASVQLRSWPPTGAPCSTGCPGSCSRCNNRNTNVILSHDGRGRLSKGDGTGVGPNKCGGIGLCDVQWFPWCNGYEEEIDDIFIRYGSVLQYDGLTGQFYIEVLLAETPPSNIARESFNFHIDEYMPLETKEFTNDNLAIQQGVYSLNPDLGVAGGYRIPVVVQ